MDITSLYLVYLDGDSKTLVAKIEKYLRNLDGSGKKVIVSILDEEEFNIRKESNISRKKRRSSSDNDSSEESLSEESSSEEESSEEVVIKKDSYSRKSEQEAQILTTVKTLGKQQILPVNIYIKADHLNLRTYLLPAILFYLREIGNLFRLDVVTDFKRKIFFVQQPDIDNGQDIVELPPDMFNLIAENLDPVSIIALKRTSKMFSDKSTKDVESYTSKNVQTHLMTNLMKIYSLEEIATIFIISPVIVGACIDLGIDISKQQKKYGANGNVSLTSYANEHGSTKTRILLFNSSGDKNFFSQSDLDLYVESLDVLFGKVVPPKCNVPASTQWEYIKKSLDNPGLLRELINRGFNTFYYDGVNIINYIIDNGGLENDNISWLFSVPGIGKGFNITPMSLHFFQASGLLVDLLTNEGMISTDVFLTAFKYILLTSGNNEMLQIFVTFAVSQAYDISNYVTDINIHLLEKSPMIAILKCSETTAPVINAIEMRYLEEKIRPSWTSFFIKFNMRPDEFTFEDLRKFIKTEDLIDADYNWGNIRMIVPSRNYVVIDYFLRIFYKSGNYPSSSNYDTKAFKYKDNQDTYISYLIKRIEHDLPSLAGKISQKRKEIGIPKNLHSIISTIEKEFNEDIELGVVVLPAVVSIGMTSSQISSFKKYKKNILTSIKYNMKLFFGEDVGVRHDDKNIYIEAPRILDRDQNYHVSGIVDECLKLEKEALIIYTTTNIHFMDKFFEKFSDGEKIIEELLRRAIGTSIDFRVNAGYYTLLKSNSLSLYDIDSVSICSFLDDKLESILREFEGSIKLNGNWDGFVPIQGYTLYKITGTRNVINHVLSSLLKEYKTQENNLKVFIKWDGAKEIYLFLPNKLAPSIDKMRRDVTVPRKNGTDFTIEIIKKRLKVGTTNLCYLPESGMTTAKLAADISDFINSGKAKLDRKIVIISYSQTVVYVSIPEFVIKLPFIAILSDMMRSKTRKIGLSKSSPEEMAEKRSKSRIIRKKASVETSSEEEVFEIKKIRPLSKKRSVETSSEESPPRKSIRPPSKSVRPLPK